MYTRSVKVQTAFRFDKALLERLKRKARQEGKSLNSFVEDSLSKLAPAEPEWTKIKGPVVIPDEIREMSTWMPRPFTEKELKEDDRLEYLLNR